MGSAIDIRGLVKDYPLPFGRGRRLRALDDLSLTIPVGQVFGLLGPNGSGKSTTVKILLGLAKMTSGECLIFGEPIGSREARKRIGYLPDSPAYYGFLTGEELLLYYGELAGLDRSVRKRQCGELLEQFRLTEAARLQVKAYSKGMLQRLGLAQALLGDPDILVLDEPTAGVDPVGAKEMGEFIQEFRSRGKTVLLSSHLLSQVEQICDRIAILHKGKLLLEGDTAGILDNATAGCGDLRLSQVSEEAKREIEVLGARLGFGVSRGGQSLDDLFCRLASEKERQE